MSARRSLLVGLIAAALVAVASPALAMTPKAVIPGWSPSDPPLDRLAFDAQLGETLYAVSCRGATATGWSSSMVDDTTYDWRSMLVTTSAVGTACTDTRSDLVVRQGSAIYPAYPWIVGSPTGLGSIAVIPLRPGAYWDESPTPRLDQWVAIGGRTPDGALLPVIERRIVAVDSTAFTLDQAVGSDYLGAPVVDNKLRVLGTLTSAGTEVTGSPVYCDVLFVCADKSMVWRDITAPSAVTDVKKIPGKGKVTFAWKAAADDGGAEVAYWYRIGIGPWMETDTFRVTVKARKGQLVTVGLGTVNDAGPGPTVIVSARAR